MELTTTSGHSVNQQNDITEQPNRLSRWWMRHYRHIGLASIAGSAILVCIIAVILLPIVVHHSAKDPEQCVNETNSLIGSTTANTKSSTLSTTITGSYTSSTMAQIVAIDPLCAANATWKSEAVTVAGLSNGTNSSSRAGLKGPNDLLIDANGNLFVADSNNNRVVYWSINATEGSIVAGTGALGSWINLFKYAASIVAWKDQLYVADRDNYRILAFPLTTTEGSPDGMTVVGRYGAGSALNQISHIYSMVIDKTRELFYLSDSQNNRILKLNLADNTLQLAVGTGIADSNNLSLNLSLGMTVDQTTGSLYVVDSQNHRVQKFHLNSIAGITVAGGINGGQDLSQLYLPSGVAIDPTGNVYVADSGNHRIVQWLVGAQQGRLIAGTGIAGAGGIQLNYPVQLKFDVHQNLYVVDQHNNRIQRFDLLHNGC